MKNKLIISALFIWISCLFLSCEKKEIAFDLPEPSLVLVTPIQPVVTQEPGRNVFLTLTLQAASGLKELQITRNGAAFETISYTRDEISSTYNFDFDIPQTASAGERYTFEFILRDKSDRTTSYRQVINVNQTYGITDEVIGGVAVKRIKGRVNGNFTFAANLRYVIDSIFSIEDNGTLTIEAGSTVYFRTSADAGDLSRLVIARGSRIIAQGTRSQPIVFTSDKLLTGATPSSTDWGGIFIYGNAPTNQGSVIQEEGFRYGGTLVGDDSGILEFVRIEYAGKNGSNAIHFFGVGNRTRLNYIQVYKNENIAFRIKGGGFNLKYIAAIAHGGYGIWAEHGWRGNGQFWIFQTDIRATLVPVNFWNQARSVEFRNDDNSFTVQPRTEFRLSNITLIGNGFAQGTDLGSRRGIRIRTGAFGTVQNIIVTQFPNDGVRVEDLSTTELNSAMQLGNTRAYNNSVNYEGDASRFFFNQNGNSEQPVTGISLSSFVGSVPSSFNPQSLGSFFSPASFIGAVENDGNDWTRGGSWFKNLNGTIRQ